MLAQILRSEAGLNILNNIEQYFTVMLFTEIKVDFKYKGKKKCVPASLLKEILQV